MKDEKALKGKTWLKLTTKPYKKSVFFLTVVAIITTALSLAFAYLVKYLINGASSGNATLLCTFAGVLLGLLLLKILFQTLSGYFSEKLRAKITSELRVSVFSKILRSDYAKTQEYHSGELLNRLTSDITEIAVDTVGLLPAVVGMSVQCAGAIVALLTIDPLFTAIYVVCGAGFCLITWFFRQKIKKKQKEVLQADGVSRSFMQEGISSIMTLKAYGAEEKTTKKARYFANNYFEKRMKRNFLNASMHAVFTLLSNFGLIFAVVWCALTVLLNPATADYGSILSIILLLVQLQHPLTAVSSVLPVFYSRQASAERLQEIDEFPCETLSSNTISIKEVYENTNSISFENIAFNYGRESVLTNASVVFNKGKIVCLTGASGAGKSTLFKLLLSVFTPSSGAINLVNGDNKTPLTSKERGLFAYVPQGNFLFSGTIYENLTFFSEETDKEILQNRIDNALKVACADFVGELPDGLQTILSEGGNGLSEGQMQRLAVARAIVSDKPILLLDEATSALDNETEKTLLENIRNLQDKTCLIVTHRPGALAIADKIVKVENGKISPVEK